MADDSNLCPSERGSRIRSAVVLLGVTLAAIVAMTELEVPLAARALIAVPLFIVSLQLVQASTGVCVFHARRGTRTTEGVVEGLLDPRQRARVRSRGLRVMAAAAGLTLTATAIVLAVGILA